MKKGVITVYLALTFSVLMSLFTGAFEAAKISAYRVVAECAAQSGILSSFGEYNRELLKQYDLLFVDLSYQTDKASYRALSDSACAYMQLNLSEPETRYLFSRDFWGSGTAEAQITAVRKATDEYGKVLQNQAVEYMKDEISADIITDLLSLVRVRNEYDLNEESVRNYADEIKKQAEEVTFETENADGGAGDENNGTDTGSNYSLADEMVIKEMSDWDIEIKYLRPIDYLILKKDAGDVTARVFNPLDFPSLRMDNIRLIEDDFKEDTFDPFKDAYFTEYIVRKTGNYTRPKENSYLKYEAEYIIAGQSNESANLSYTIHYIFYIRTAANVISLQKDKDKKEAIKNVSEGLSSITSVPPAVYEGLITLIWAAGEATFDVDDLLEGERVSLIKKGEDFHLSLKGGIKNLLTDSTQGIKSLPDHSSGSNLPAVTDLGEYSGNGKSLEIDIKLSYEDYLRLLILGVLPTFRSTRMMDIIETDIRQTKDNSHFRIDMCLDGAVFEIVITNAEGIRYELRRKYCY